MSEPNTIDYYLNLNCNKLPSLLNELKNKLIPMKYAKKGDDVLFEFIKSENDKKILKEKVKTKVVFSDAIVTKTKLLLMKKNEIDLFFDNKIDDLIKNMNHSEVTGNE